MNVRGNAVELFVAARDLEQYARIVGNRVRAGNYNLPNAALQTGQRVRGSIPAVEFANQVNCVRTGRPFAEDPAVLRSMKAVIKISVCKRNEIRLVAEQTLAALSGVPLHAQLDITLVGLEKGDPWTKSCKKPFLWFSS